MKTPSASPKNQQRQRVVDAYRGRGRRTNALWLVYSIKIKRDLILSGDRFLVHWIQHLETNPLVKYFEYCSDSKYQSKQFIKVYLSNGTIESHYLLSEASLSIPPHTTENSVSDKFFHDSDLRPFVKSSMKWLKAISFAAAIRDRQLQPDRIALASEILVLKKGNVLELTSRLKNFDQASILGLIVESAIAGQLTLDIDQNGFNFYTVWQLRERAQNVVT